MKYLQNLRVDGNKVFSYNTHVATIWGDSLVILGYWSVTTSKHVNHVATERGLTKLTLEQAKEQGFTTESSKENSDNSPFKLAAMFGLMAQVLEPNNGLGSRINILKSLGCTFPDDFTELPTEEQLRRIEAAEAQMQTI